MNEKENMHFAKLAEPCTSCKEKIDVTKPDYYGKLDVLGFCLCNDIPFCEGNIIKYIMRYTKKNGLEDLLKAQEYLNRLIENFRRNKNE